MENQDQNITGKNLKIYTYPSPILLKKAEAVTLFDEQLKRLSQDMLKTMYDAPGIGLACPQIGKSIRMFVMDIDYDRDVIVKADESEEVKLTNFNPRVIINPLISDKKGELCYEEGCLSVPGVYEEIKRAENIKLTYQDLNGVTQTLEAEGTLAVCIQHETDHLEGIVFIERLSMLKRNIIKKKIIKEKKRQENKD